MKIKIISERTIGREVEFQVECDDEMMELVSSKSLEGETIDDTFQRIASKALQEYVERDNGQT